MDRFLAGTRTAGAASQAAPAPAHVGDPDGLAELLVEAPLTKRHCDEHVGGSQKGEAREQGAADLALLVVHRARAV
jgi:hypothetical protein